MKIRPVGAKLFRADGQTDRLTCRSLIIAFSNFDNSPENFQLLDYIVIIRGGKMFGANSNKHRVYIPFFCAVSYSY